MGFHTLGKHSYGCLLSALGVAVSPIARKRFQFVSNRSQAVAEIHSI